MTVHDNIIPAIDCVDFVRIVDDLVDSDPAQWGPIVAKHLEDCPPCLVYLQQMLDLKVLLNHVFEGRGSATNTSPESFEQSTTSPKATRGTGSRPVED